MKRVTIALDDEMYLSLLEYASQRSKREMRRFSMGEAIRDMVASRLQTNEAGEKANQAKRVQRISPPV